MISIHVVKYETPEGNSWEYRSATTVDTDTGTAAIRENADRQAAETDPALAFVSHDISQPGSDAAADDDPTDEPTA
jgi:hypothetical protein